MSDDSFFREVNEELRSERLRTFWARYGWMIIAGFILIVVATAAWRGYEYWQSRQAAASGDAFLQALTLANEGQAEEALAALETLQNEGHGAYPVLARMRAATLQAESGDVDAAIAAFREIGEDGAAPQAVREVAQVRAAYLLVDHGSYDDVLAAVGPLATDDHALRHSARETLGLAAWKAGDLETAGDWFDQIASDEDAPVGFSQRAEIMLDLIAAASGEAPEVADQPAQPAGGGESEAGATGAPLMLEDIAPELAPIAPGADAAEEPAAPESPAETVPLAPLDENPS